jgi:5-hydroxyisourate hydrolase-like protein (transthyretin family)
VYPWLFCVSAFAAVDGTVINRTTGQPSVGTILQLVQPGQGGMQTLASAKTDAEGKFRFNKDTQGPALIQAIFSGVLYTKVMMPGTPTHGVEVDVFQSTNKPGTAKVSQHFIVLQPGASEMAVSEGILYQGDPKLTYNDSANGSFRFYLPPEAHEKVSVTINAPGGMPIQRPAQKTAQANIYKVDYPIKPGETRFDLNYTIPVANPLIFSGKILHAEGASDLVIPTGVTVKGDNLELAGQEPKTQASIYRIKGNEYKVTVEGTGGLQPAAEALGSGSGSEEDNGAPTIQEVKPRIYDRLYLILGIAFATLAAGSVALYRSSPKKG